MSSTAVKVTEAMQAADHSQRGSKLRTPRHETIVVISQLFVARRTPAGRWHDILVLVPPLMMPLSKQWPSHLFPRAQASRVSQEAKLWESVNATRRLGTLRRAPSVPHAGSTAIVSNPVRLDGYKKLEGENQGNRTAAGGPMDPRRPRRFWESPAGRAASCNLFSSDGVGKTTSMDMFWSDGYI
ncbi:hypothetical protein CI102_192 [Trichoderma harzianum]|uniref:Uncharacterized protein n=1 Tax=Trichoderma harzianum CBS 226.95 TaxID=983964 RepID=A0A2T4ALC4_TRIHA|nr:hypothetical protein M431DRAFT_492122 [Trichoderma harzianum CBS 226.95]PKK55107.1 hypothetical protein CI102_192 [Trichoderma harzianum]PTB57885.1 hypothetical protein M431DRAFT_492122 [Trichoderma harzianum CBS 226.95]